jgi:hypothetical protein
MASEIKVDTVSEKTSANGVTIDGVNIKDSKITTANSIDSDAYVDGSIDNAHIADDAVDSEHYADGSIDNAHIADDAVDSEHYADGSIDNAHIADDAIDSEHYAAGSIDTAHIADNQITLAKMAGGTDGNVISYDASGDPVAIATGSDGQVLTSTGAGSPPAFETAGGGYTAGSVTATTSGSNIDFTSIPSTVTIMHLIFDNIGTDGNDQLMFQIGDSGGIETSSYIGGWSRHSGTSTTGGTTTDGIDIRKGSPDTYVVSGVISLYLCDPANNAWIMSSQTVVTNTADGNVQFDQRAVGYKSLSGTLTQIRLDTDGSNSYDQGEAILRYI